MSYESDDIQFSDMAKGLGRALRLRSTDSRVTFSQDSDNAKITIVNFGPPTVKEVTRVTKSSSFTVGALGEIQAEMYIIDASANMVITMPDTAGNDNKYSFLRIDGLPWTVSIQGFNGTEEIDGSPSYSLVTGDAPSFITDYTDWYKV